MFQKIQLRFILITLGTLAFGVGLSFFVMNQVILNNFTTVESNNALSTSKRVLNAFTEEAESLYLNAISWSYWDDIYNFVIGTNPAFVTSNLRVDSVFDTKWNHLLIVNEKDEIVYDQKMDRKERKLLEVEGEVREYVKNVLKPRWRNGGTPYLTTISNVGGNNYLFYIGEIKKNDNSGDQVGQFVVSRALDEQLLQKYSVNLLADIRLVNKAELPTDFQMLRPMPNDLIITRPILESLLDSTSPVYVEVKIDRLAYTYAKETFITLMVFLLMIFGTASILQYLLIGGSIFGRLLKVTQQVSTVQNLHTAQIEVLAGTDEIAQLSKRTHEMLERLKEDQVMLEKTSRYSTLGEMSATVAHEINNPLSIIKMISNNSKGRWDVINMKPEDVATAFQRINKTADKISKIVKSLRSFGRDGTADPFEQVPLSTLLEDALSLLEHKIKIKEVNLRFDYTQLDHSLHVRQVLFTQVLMNLISNSIDAISVLPERWIDVQVEVANGTHAIRIIDSGSGIPEEIADKLMDSVYTTKGVGSGTGLGLRLCKNIVEGHGGQFYLDRNQAHTTFVIVIPMAQSQTLAA